MTAARVGPVLIDCETGRAVAAAIASGKVPMLQKPRTIKAICAMVATLGSKVRPPSTSGPQDGAR